MCHRAEGTGTHKFTVSRLTFRCNRNTSDNRNKVRKFPCNRQTGAAAVGGCANGGVSAVLEGAKSWGGVEGGE